VPGKKGPSGLYAAGKLIEKRKKFRWASERIPEKNAQKTGTPLRPPLKEPPMG